MFRIQSGKKRVRGVQVCPSVFLLVQGAVARLVGITNAKVSLYVRVRVTTALPTPAPSLAKDVTMSARIGESLTSGLEIYGFAHHVITKLHDGSDARRTNITIGLTITYSGCDDLGKTTHI